MTIGSAVADTTVADLENSLAKTTYSTEDFGPEAANLLQEEAGSASYSSDAIATTGAADVDSDLRSIATLGSLVKVSKLDQPMPLVAQLVREAAAEPPVGDVLPPMQAVEPSQESSESENVSQPLSEPEPAAIQPDAVTQGPEPPEFSDTAESIAPAERSQVFFQAAFLQQGDDTSARLRTGGIYVLSPSVFCRGYGGFEHRRVVFRQ
ncbi:MAG: hypothetical protein HC929_04440 [Leptolyngbyaceae cyanobacterium SM2_5_2]|nr:hypothetical protein [Leptolyngbyaceae cyanobacterium SM2_5_2]